MTVALFLCSVVIILCLVAHKLSAKLGVPALLLFLVLGMVFGSDGLFKISFDDYGLAEQICSITLIFIMFYGGFDTNWKAAKPVAARAFLLSALGTVATAGLTGLFCHFVLGFELLESFLIGSVISSTDAASVFSILRSKKLNLKGGLASMLELESGSNDPFSYMLTVIVLGLMTESGGASFGYMLFAQVLFGLLVGAAVAFGGRLILQKMRFKRNGLDTIFVVACALLAFSVASLVGGNGYLSVYLAGIILGNSPISNKVSLVHFFDGVCGLLQILLFFLLGLLSFPSQMPQILLPSALIALFLTFVGRPAAVFAILSPFKTPIRQQAFVAFAGLRGAASIVFAIMVMVSGVSTTGDVFHIVFCVCLFSVLFQGTLLPIVAKKLNLVDEEESVMKTFNDYVDDSAMELIKIRISAAHAWCGSEISEIEFPENSLVVLLQRDGDTVIPQGDTKILAGDVIYLSCETATHEADLVLTEEKIQAGHPWTGKRLRDISMPSGRLVVLVYRNGGAVMPKGDTTVREGDILVFNQ